MQVGGQRLQQTPLAVPKQAVNVHGAVSQLIQGQQLEHEQILRTASNCSSGRNGAPSVNGRFVPSGTVIRSLASGA